jgi:diphthamide synthase (EF-2-diphthine--ammonia ligase)
MRSVPPPLNYARNSTSYHYTPIESLEQQAAAVEVPVTRWVQAGPAERAAIYEITVNVMRAGEYLRLVVSDAIGNDRLYVHAEKGSADYVIYLPGYDKQFAGVALISPGRLVCGTTYQRVYRACTRVGLGARKMDRIVMARTHLARYNLVEKVGRHGGRAVGDLLHHRSPSTASYYGVKQGG